MFRMESWNTNLRNVVGFLSFVRDILTHEKDAESRNGVSSLYALHAAAKAYIAP